MEEAFIRGNTVCVLSDVQGCIDASGSLKMFHYLQRILLAHRIEPLSGIV